MFLPTSGQTAGSEIDVLWQRSTQKVWHVPCDCCGEMIPYIWTQPKQKNGDQLPGGMKFASGDDVLFDDAMILSLTDLDQFRVLRCRDLNAQCYMNERTMIVTTMAISDLPSTGIHVGLSASSEETAFTDARRYIDDLKSADDVKVTEVFREIERREVKKPRGSRSPILRVVGNGIRKKWSASRARVEKKPVCEICNESFSMEDHQISHSRGQSELSHNHSQLCSDCARRKRYQHTSLYLAADSA